MGRRGRGAEGRRAPARRWIGALVVAGVVGAPLAAAGGDPALACRRAVARGAAKLAAARLAALRKCEDAKRRGALPAFPACRDEPAVAAAFATAIGRLSAAVDRGCGGADKRCGTADDPPLAAVAWPGVCPELEGSGCATVLAGCGDVPACVACLGDTAVGRGVALVYAPFVAADAKTQKAIVRCQKALATAATALAGARLAMGARCLDGRLAGMHAAPCPLPGDGRAAAKLAKARAKAEAGVCKACGGADKRCGGGDDLARELVGVASACPGIGLCDTAIASFADAVACFDCSAAARIDCALAGAAPGLADYPEACAAAPPTPTATVTPTPTATPSASPTFTPPPTPTATPRFCPRDASRISRVTIGIATGGPLLGAASVTLDYDPERVRLDGAGDDPAVRAAVTDLTGGALLGRGAPNNQDRDGDGAPDRLRVTLVAANGVAGDVLRVAFALCAGAALPAVGDYACAVVPGSAIAADAVTPLPNAACALAVENVPPGGDP
ncbi:MAG: hypothetical protein IT294_07715 [Deltaproteobacteria bacterium]|nr:hypothetical protein [Deltaproteobacteria bacterium]